MPPVNPGSRTGLITAVVIFTILFVTATVFAIYFYLDARQTRELAQNWQARYTDILPEAAFPRADVQELLTLRREEEQYRNLSVVNILIAQREELVRTITGSTGTAAQARQAARNTLTTAATQLQQAQAPGVNLPSTEENLLGAVDTLTQGVVAGRNELAQLQQQLQEVQQEYENAVQNHQQQLAERDRALEEIRTQTQQIIAEFEETGAATRGTVQQIQEAAEQDRADAFESLQALQVEISTLQRERERIERDLQMTRRRLSDLRMPVTDPLIRRPDGQIQRLPGDNLAIINLGQGDQIIPGMTFEVYDRTEGVPSLGDVLDLDDVPAGKASIEVIRVGSTSSEARIVRQQPGTQLVHGDLIFNLIYDPNVRFNFFVHGNFDLNRDGRATAQDAQVIRRLVTQWGAQVTDQLNVNTDFVVLGMEPYVPSFTRQELQDPVNQRILYEAQQRHEEYMRNLDTARELHIPIMNQNQFLFFTGYYAQARR